MAAPKQSALFQLAEISPYRRRRNLEAFRERKDSDLTDAEQLLQNHLRASLGSRGFF